MQRHAGSIVVCLTLFCAACSAQELTRPKAAELITKNEKFPEIITRQIRVGQVYVPETSLDKFASENPGGRWIKILSGRGQLTMVWQGVLKNPYVRDGQDVGSVVVELTTVGKTFQLGADEKDANGKYAVVKMCEKQFDAITGIRMIDQSTASVEYKWKFGNMSPFGAAEIDLGGAWGLCGPSAFEIPRPATMRRYDDGWRMAR